MIKKIESSEGVRAAGVAQNGQVVTLKIDAADQLGGSGVADVQYSTHSDFEGAS